MPYFDFIWTEEIARHLSENGILPEDFERVVCSPQSKGYSRTSTLPLAWGWTVDGRYIVAVYEEIDEVTILPVTAYEVPEPN